MDGWRKKEMIALKSAKALSCSASPEGAQTWQTAMTCTQKKEDKLFTNVDKLGLSRLVWPDCRPANLEKHLLSQLAASRGPLWPAAREQSPASEAQIHLTTI